MSVAIASESSGPWPLADVLHWSTNLAIPPLQGSEPRRILRRSGRNRLHRASRACSGRVPGVFRAGIGRIGRLGACCRARSAWWAALPRPDDAGQRATPLGWTWPDARCPSGKNGERRRGHGDPARPVPLTPVTGPARDSHATGSIEGLGNGRLAPITRLRGAKTRPANREISLACLVSTRSREAPQKLDAARDRGGSTPCAPGPVALAYRSNQATVSWWPSPSSMSARCSRALPAETGARRRLAAASVAPAQCASASISLRARM